MKIAIIGGGISGLSTYLFLKKLLPLPSSDSHDIRIYEAYPSPRRSQRNDSLETGQTRSTGGGIGVSPNGMAQLAELDPSLLRAITAQGYPGTRILLQNSHGWKLAQTVNRKVQGETEVLLWSSRQGVWDCIRDLIPDEAIVSGKRVSRVVVDAVKNSKIEFSDGDKVEADLVIGADGVKSIVKKAVVGDGASDEYPPHYEGLLGIGGFMPSSYLSEGNADGTKRPAFTMTFGAEGFFGYGPCSTPAGYVAPSDADPATYVAPVGDRAMWWSTFESDEVQDMKSIDVDEVRAKLRQRHGDWADPVVRRLAQDMEIELLTPSWTLPKLPRWSRDGVVLIGDSAHALPTSSGQGVSQALEDAHMFSLALAHHLAPVYAGGTATETSKHSPAAEREAIDAAGQLYFDLRSPRLSHILDRAQKMGGKKKRMNFLQEYLTYAFLYVFFNFMPDTWSPYLYNYNIKDELKKALKE
ncbi:MAG: hypothetical protein M1825_000733 [Sarcosagium campestre]|nr:MAG: hypothetical protein M1825_000733 [Sarcosagium campestre]